MQLVCRFCVWAPFPCERKCCVFDYDYVTSPSRCICTFCIGCVQMVIAAHTHVHIMWGRGLKREREWLNVMLYCFQDNYIGFGTGI